MTKKEKCSSLDMLREQQGLTYEIVLLLLGKRIVLFAQSSFSMPDFLVCHRGSIILITLSLYFSWLNPQTGFSLISDTLILYLWDREFYELDMSYQSEEEINGTIHSKIEFRHFCFGVSCPDLEISVVKISAILQM